MVFPARRFFFCSVGAIKARLCEVLQAREAQLPILPNPEKWLNRRGWNDDTHALAAAIEVQRWLKEVTYKRRQSVLQKLVLLSASCMLLLQSMGCVSIRQAAPSHMTPIANCSNATFHSSLQEESCELHDRREVLRQWVSKLKPGTVVPRGVVGWAGNCKDRSVSWISNQCGRCSAAKASVQEWIQQKKDEANAPPWPRFHPVPTQNVFEPQNDAADADSPAVPEVYGRFGKG